MGNHYAIVSDNLKNAIDWFKNGEHGPNISEYVTTHVTFYMKNKDKYKIVYDVRQSIQGYHFDGILICPTYTDLLTEVKKRLR
jgi:hypothetical protein